MSHAGSDRQYHTLREIVSQPEVWRSVLHELPDPALAIAAQIRGAGSGEALFVGCGSPFYLTRSAAAMYQQIAGVPSQATPASDLMLFPDLVLANDRPRVAIAVSRSGETTEVIKALQTFRQRLGGPIVGITCYEDTSLQRAADHALIARAAHEQSLAQTRSFTSMLLLTQALIYALADRPVPDALRQLPDHCAGLLENYGTLARQLGEDASIDRFFFLGSGPFYGLACEAMLKMKEMSLSYSEAYHFLEFRHGPMAMIDRRSLVVGMVGEAALAHEAAVLREMRQLGARVLAITPVQLRSEEADWQVLVPRGLGDIDRAALYLPISQLMTFWRALHNGLDPDLPTNLNAVVHLDVDSIERQSPHSSRPSVA